MKLGMNVGMRGSPDEFTAYVKRLEEAGVDYLWAGEAYSADSVSTMGFLAAVTRRAIIGSSILPLYTRTPTVLAMTAVGMDKVSNGRFILGLGASGPQVIEGFHGVPYDAPLARTREIVDICRSVWRQDRLNHQGDRYQIPLSAGRGTGLGKALRITDHPIRAQIPIFLASLGPKNVELTAEVADGWLPLHFWPDRADEVWGSSLESGTTKRLPELGPLDIVAGGPLAIGDDVAHLRDKGRPMLALYFGGMGARGQNYYNEVLQRYGFEKEAHEIQEAYLGGDRKSAANLVPQPLVDGMSLIGDPGFVRDRIAAYREAGTTILNVQPVGSDKLRDIESIASWLT
jgi:F420-dependent oxidoreductase-like protein